MRRRRTPCNSRSSRSPISPDRRRFRSCFIVVCARSAHRKERTIPMPCSEADTHSKRLTLRDSTADDGTRPLADGTAYWESPDLFINGGIDPGTAKVGADNHLMANVHNETQAPI